MRLDNRYKATGEPSISPKMMKEQELFRLAAILYRDRNYGTNRKTTIRKILESIYIANQNMPLTIESIQDYCRDIFGLGFSTDEIKEALNKDKKTLAITKSDGVVKYSLSSKRIEYIKSEIEIKSISEHIDHYLISKFGKIDQDRKDKLFTFLYNTFTTNLNNYESFLKAYKSSNFEEELNVEAKDRELINDFLLYDDDEKNKSIFDLVALSLEYCLLASPKEIPLEVIENKMFYLDTNIIFRALGFNGIERKKSTLTFLRECSRRQIKFKIFKDTELEFKSAIEIRIKNIYALRDHKVNPDVFSDYLDDEFYEYYANWCHGKANISKDYFDAHVGGLYSKFLSDFSIENDNYNYRKKLNEEDIRTLSLSIAKSKRETSDGKGNLRRAENDALILLSMQMIRKQFKDEGGNLLSRRFFFISTDQQLRRWEYSELGEDVPLILLPSQWMTIMYRFGGRSDDDYKSFINFITIKTPQKRNTEFSQDQIMAILTGIAEMSEEVTEQKYYAEMLINNDAAKIISINEKDVLSEKVKEFVKEDYEQRIRLSDEEMASKNEKIEGLILEKEKLEEEFDDLKRKNVKTEKERLNVMVNSEFKLWRLKGYLGILLLLVTIYIILAHLYPTSLGQSGLGKFILLVRSSINNDQSSVGLYDILIATSVIGLFGYSCRLIYRLFPNTQLSLEKREEIKKMLQHKDGHDVTT